MTAPLPIYNHPQLGPVTYQVTELPDDPGGQVAQTIDLMRQYAIEDSRSPEIRQACLAAYRTGDSITDTFDSVKARLRFQRDEATAAPWQEYTALPIVETLYRPRDLVVAPVEVGDCDDYSMLGAAQLLANGIPCSFVTVGVADSDPTNFSHVYLAAYPKTGKYAGRRVPLDMSHGPYPGWETPGITKIKEWPIDNSSNMILLGLAAAGMYFVARAFRKGAN